MLTGCARVATDGGCVVTNGGRTVTGSREAIDGGRVVTNGGRMVTGSRAAIDGGRVDLVLTLALSAPVICPSLPISAVRHQSPCSRPPGSHQLPTGPLTRLSSNSCPPDCPITCPPDLPTTCPPDHPTSSPLSHHLSS